MAYTVAEIRKMAADISPRVAVWQANDTRGGRSGWVTIALLPAGVERKPRACEHKDKFDMVFYFTAWRGMISATKQIRRALDEISQGIKD